MTQQIAKTDDTQAPTISPAAPKPPSKLDRIEALLKRQEGASIDEMMEATNWQQHSVRGAIAGALKKRLGAIASTKTDGVRRYRIDAQ